MKLNKLKKIIVGLLTLTSLVSFTACGSSASSKSASAAGTVKISISSEPDNLDPMMSAASDTSAIMMNVYEGLLSFNEKGEIVPCLAENYTITDDGLTYTFKLKKDVKFHNGKAFTSKDAAYTYTKLAGLNGEKPLSSTLNKAIESVSCPDDNTFVIKLKARDAGFITKATLSIQQDGYKDDSKLPIGTGPFKFEEYVEGQK